MRICRVSVFCFIRDYFRRYLTKKTEWIIMITVFIKNRYYERGGMIVEWNLMRLRFLFYLNHSEASDRSVTAMARTFGTSKSTISRNIEVFVNQGIVIHGSLDLSGFGKTLAEKYEKEVVEIRKYLSTVTGKSPEDMTTDAIMMVLNLSEETRQSIMEKQKIQNLLFQLDNKHHPKTEEVLSVIEDGEYHLPFTIYRENMEDIQKGYTSMADWGFAHPVNVIVENGNAMVGLKAVTLEHRSLMEELIIKGKLLRMKYLSGKEYLETRQEGDTYYFPLSALEFTFHKEENMLQGSTKLMMESPMKKKKHIRAAVLTIFFK